MVNAVADKNVSATDRTKHGVDLADYFADFLSVAGEVSDTELSDITRKVLKGALQACIEHLPGKDLAKALKKAQANLGTRTLIDENAIVEAVMLVASHPEDDKIAARLEKETRTRVKKSKLHELSFKPDRKILRQPYMRKIVTTAPPVR